MKNYSLHSSFKPTRHPPLARQSRVTITRPRNKCGVTGFTLIELSIVLVIIGLIVGGILAGRELIKAADLKNIYTEFQRYDNAANIYREKYNALAGDDPNAYAKFGDACGTNTTDLDTGCNGDGNGKIGYDNLDNIYGEEPKFFEHLARAGIIPGNYDGSCVNEESCVYNPGINVPKSRYGGAVWGALYGAGESGIGTAVLNSNVFVFTKAIQDNGLPSYTFRGTYDGGILPVQDMWSIDSKYDDGNPNSGKIASFGVDSTYCVSDQDPASAYNLTTATQNCSAYFRPSGF